MSTISSSEELIVVTSVSISIAVILLIALVVIGVCLWRYCYSRSGVPPPPTTTNEVLRRESKSSSNKGGGVGGAGNGEHNIDKRGTLLLPRHMAVGQWLDAPPSTRRGLRNLSREDIVNLSPKQRLKLLEIPQSKICLLSEITETNFGKVYRGEASRLLGNELSTAVTVKSLNESLDNPTPYQDFHVEMVWASGFDHPNILRLLGVCTIDVPRYIVYEYAEFGNLVEFLQSTALVWLEMDLQSRASLSSFTAGDNQPAPPPNQQLVGNEELVTIAIQIADGLDYISSKKIVIKDIGARNCQVGRGLSVKISEFGLSYGLRSEDYCCVGSKDSYPVPLRWLSPEALSNQRYSMYSDIWSYGVLLWEVFALGERPYNQLSNAEVVESILHHKTLQIPDHCPEEIFAVMKSCWCVQPTDRQCFEVLREQLVKTQVNFDISDVSKRFSIRTPDLRASSVPRVTTPLDS